MFYLPFRMPHCLLHPGAGAAGTGAAAGSRSAVRICRLRQNTHCTAVPDTRSANELKQLFTYLTLFVSLNQSCFHEIHSGRIHRGRYHRGRCHRGKYHRGRSRTPRQIPSRKVSAGQCTSGPPGSSGIKDMAVPLEKGISCVPKTPDTRSPALRAPVPFKVPVPFKAETGNAPVT